MLLKTKNSKSCHPITEDGSFMCTAQGCDFTTKYKFSLQRHTNKCHPRVSSRRSKSTKLTARESRGGSSPPSKNFKCNKCSYSTALKANLKRHFSTHSNTKYRPFQCHYCEYRSQWKHNVNVHEKARHSNIPSKIPPEKMNKRDRKVIKTLGTKKGQQNNLQLDTLRLRISPDKSLGHSEGNFPCKDCDYVSKNKRLLSSHMEESHSDDAKAFSCTFRGCTYRSKWLQWARAHERRAHNFTRRQSTQQVKSKAQQKPTTLACKKVNSLTARVVKVDKKRPTEKRPTKSNSAQILSRKKAGSKREKVKCPQCDVQCYPRFLQRHLQVHSAEKPFSCSFKGCNYRTRWTGDLKVHKKRHDKDLLKSPSAAPLLTRSSDRQRKVGMKATVRQKAQEIIIKRFKCPDCDFHGSTSWHVNRHRHTHKNIPPIRCPKLRCRFTTRDVRNLAKHQLESHSNEQVSRSSSRQTLQPNSDAKGCRFCGCNNKSHVNVKKNVKGRRGWKPPTAVDQPEMDKEQDDEEEEKENYKEPLIMEPVVEELVDSTGFACMLCDFVGFSEAAALNHAKSHTQPTFPVRKLSEIPIISLD